MDTFYKRLAVRAATIDELLSDDFVTLPGQKGDSDLAARRLAAWCRSCASGDWSLLERRLGRDGSSIAQALIKFATVRKRHSASKPVWLDDAIWIDSALQQQAEESITGLSNGESCAFQDLFSQVVERASARLRSEVGPKAFNNLNESARASLGHSLLNALSDLAAPAIYEGFAKSRANPESIIEQQQDAGVSEYIQFITELRSGGLRHLFEEKPVLLRLIALVTRQWINTSREFILRLDADMAMIRREFLQSSTRNRVNRIEGEVSDPHNAGHSVKIATFEDGSRVVYKPKDLRLDAAWHALATRLNEANAPVQLKAMRTMPRHGYGWTEFIQHAGCADEAGCKRFFGRCGAWLALFHCFASIDMHQENIIAAGDHPVPIDLEMLLQAKTEEYKSSEAEEKALEAAMETVTNSVVTVGLLPSYGKSSDNQVFAFGGMTPDWTVKAKLRWANINSNAMRPAKIREGGDTIPNLPHVSGHYAKFGDYIEDFIAGFENYAKFLMRISHGAPAIALFEGFAGLPVRKVIRPSSFYYMLLQRLRNHKTMNDGVIWSAQADFLARLANWDKDFDSLWPMQVSERMALLQLNIPHFTSPSDGQIIRDVAGTVVETEELPGLHRARARVESLDEKEIAWQVAMIRQNTETVSRSDGLRPTEPKKLLYSTTEAVLTKQPFLAEADNIADDLTRYAVCRGPSAAWIGLDWLGDSEVSQLMCLGPELYNGVSGIAVFLAAHAAVTGNASSETLALAAIAHLRKMIGSRNAARMARSLGIGGAMGLGSIVYALTVMSKCLHRNDLLDDAVATTELFTDDVIAADNQLDVVGGSAGAILSLLRLYRETKSTDVLARAINCGEFLLTRRRIGPEGHRSWIAKGLGTRALNGMSHGAAGYAYALASLALAAQREEFANSASECIAFENSSHDPSRNNWPHFRGEGEPTWPCQWCHGAAGIGLARIAMVRQRGINAILDTHLLRRDIKNALKGVELGSESPVDTMCCGTLGCIEFLREAGGILGRSDLRDLAARRLLVIQQTAASTGDYRWNAGKKQFNLGLFRGLAGVGYTFLRQVDSLLPNILIWE